MRTTRKAATNMLLAQWMLILLQAQQNVWLIEHSTSHSRPCGMVY
jgi:hypothetical protein